MKKKKLTTLQSNKLPRQTTNEHLPRLCAYNQKSTNQLEYLVYLPGCQDFLCPTVGSARLCTEQLPRPRKKGRWFMGCEVVVIVADM